MFSRDQDRARPDCWFFGKRLLWATEEKVNLLLMNSRLIPGGRLRVIMMAAVWLVVGRSAMWSASACPVITNNPACAAKCPGENVTFSVTAGPTPLAYQWRKTGNPLSGATGSTYAITSVSIADAGSYSVVVNNSAGTATSVGEELIWT